MKLTFLGDVMCTGDMLDMFKVSDRYDFSSIFSSVEPMLQNSDYVFANLETPVSPTDSDLTHEPYSFCSPIEFAQAAKDAGIDFVSTANNHCLDRSVKGLCDTIEALDKVGLEHTGTFTQPSETNPSIINVRGLKIGVCAYTYGTNAFANRNYLHGSQRRLVNMTQNQELSNRLSRWCYYNRRKFLARIYNKLSETFCPGQLSGWVYERRERSRACRRKLRRDFRFLKENNVDLSVMLLHLGGQYNHSALHAAKSLVRKVLRGGVNIVCGAHEHVVHHGVYDQVNNNRIATYSLGNFNSAAGTLTPPFGLFADYSVAWHIYIDEREKKIKRSTFTILKSVLDAEGRISVRICHDLLLNSSEDASAAQLLSDMQTVAFRFTGRRFTIEELKSKQELPLDEQS